MRISKELVAAALGCLTLIVAVATYRENRLHNRLDSAKTKRDLELVSPLLRSHNEAQDPSAHFLVVIFKNTGEIPLSVKKTTVHLVPPPIAESDMAPTRTCSGEIGHLTDVHTDTEKPEVVRVGATGTTVVLIHVPKSCLGLPMKYLLGISFIAEDQLGVEVSIAKAVSIAISS